MGETLPKNPVMKTVVAEGLGFGEVTAGSDETIASQTEFPSREGAPSLPSPLRGRGSG